MPDASPVGRLAPTPSAGLHVGNLFASIVAWLVARARGGRVLLRIEDLDTARCRREYADGIMRDYERLGITWDNEDVMFQSQRTEAYDGAFAWLDGRGLLYPCFCSRADLHAASAPHAGDRYVYAGTCRRLTDNQRARKRESRSPAYRLQAPDTVITLDDGIQGRFSQNLANECGDFIVRRSDGVYSYQLAVVVDDLQQGVTQVVRGFDLLDSAPQQSYLKSLLSPHSSRIEYWHVPLMLDASGRRLSKRDHDQSLDGVLEHFESVEHFIGYLAGLSGLTETKEPLTMQELLGEFSLAALQGVRTLSWRLP